jgi:hypothetical protein
LEDGVSNRDEIIHEATNPIHSMFFLMMRGRELLTFACHKTQHLVVHRFARKRDEKGMRYKPQLPPQL